MSSGGGSEAAGADPESSRDSITADAQQTIARQAAEIERLRRRLTGEKFTEELRGALALSGVAGTIASPVTHTRLLEMIVNTAARVISARAASLYLVDEQAQELTFEVALGPKAQEVKKLRVPLGHGIAGLVAVTGQPMAISDAQRDPRQAADIAEAIGYQPQSILCVPLFYGERITGVLQLLDKEGAASFGASDIETLGLFANLAAVAIEQSRTHRNLSALISEVLASLTGIPDPVHRGLQSSASAFAASTEEDAEYRRSLNLAQLVQAIASQGEEEARACHTILSTLSNHLWNRQGQAFASYGSGSSDTGRR
jgi:GAF domain-containing protein